MCLSQTEVLRLLETLVPLVLLYIIPVYIVMYSFFFIIKAFIIIRVVATASKKRFLVLALQKRSRIC